MKDPDKTYNLHVDDSQHFGDQISFLKLSTKKMTGIVVSNSVGISDINFADPSNCTETTANIICQEILNHAGGLPHLHWPTTVEELMERQQLSPKLLLKFLQELLQKKTTEYQTTPTKC